MTFICQISLLLFSVMYDVHIKWLVINFFLRFWLQLMEIYLLDYKSCVRFKKFLLGFELSRVGKINWKKFF